MDHGNEVLNTIRGYLVVRSRFLLGAIRACPSQQEGESSQPRGVKHQQQEFIEEICRFRKCGAYERTGPTGRHRSTYRHCSAAVGSVAHPRNDRRSREHQPCIPAHPRTVLADGPRKVSPCRNDGSYGHDADNHRSSLGVACLHIRILISIPTLFDSHWSEKHPMAVVPKAHCKERIRGAKVTSSRAI